MASRTRAADRLRAVPPEAGPAFGAQAGPLSRWRLAVLAELGGPFGIRGAGLRRFRSVAERGGGARRAAADRLWAAAAASASSGRPELAAESELVRSLAARVAAGSAEAARLDAPVSDSLAGDEAYEALLTVPGVGPKTAAALVTLVDVSLFRGHDELAAHAGLAPCNRQSGTSLNASSPSRGGNRTLKNLLICSCTSLAGTENRCGRHYDACRARGMRHNKALKAVARKRLKAIYAIMRDGVPYRDG
ncbi:transposase [Thermophilibacter provencensis]|uniref:Transposase n=1 Tax=Thermophilibacter provencensis TaxID=1852386 RepID=A0A921KLX0_9ACTN|nr:transposase [Thermophilibacter provencensis]HJF45788.1 transposase [Thermophilibacter provencensis]